MARLGIVTIVLLYGSLATVLIIKEFYLWSVLPIALLLLTLRSQYRYYTRTHPKLIDADKRAARGMLWLMLTVIFGYSIVMSLFFDPEAQESVFIWAIWPIIAVPLIYFFVRLRIFRRKAEKEIEEHKTREGNAHRESPA